MTRIALCFVWLFSTLACANLWAAEPAAAPTAIVEKLHSALTQAMKGGAKMGFAGRVAVLDPVVREAFDLPAMARVACGAAWQKMSDAEHDQIVAAFATWTVATYASQFKSYDGEVFTTKDETDAPRGRRSVNTVLKPKTGDPVAFNYQMREDEGHWKIVDIYLDGSVSQLALRRNEFAAVLAKGGASALVNQILSNTAQISKGG